LKGLQLRALEGLTSADVFGDSAPSSPAPNDYVARAENDELTQAAPRDIPTFQSFQME
jgi:hypothetical protein